FRVVARLTHLLPRELEAAPLTGGGVRVVGDERIVLEAVRHVVREDPASEVAPVRLEQGALVEDVIHGSPNVDVVEGRDRKVHADGADEIARIHFDVAKSW